MILTATFQIVTPLFLGGARQEVEGFRLASLKGALRFWWRAAEYPERFERAVHGGAGRDRAAALALATVRRDETALFGSTATGQSRVLMRLEPRRTPLARLPVGETLKEGDGRAVVGPGARYLGYGLMGAYGATMGKLERSCLRHGACVQVSFRFRRGADVASFRRALILFGLVGGLGSRARRGWGSLALVKLTEGEAGTTVWEPPATAADYTAALRAAVPTGLKHGDPLPPFTAFGPDTRIETLDCDGDPLATLDRMGRAMQRYRAWGHKGMVNNEPSERNFKDDHDWSKEPFSRAFAGFVPQRAVFGLPQNYGRNFNVAPAVPRMDRRGSPLFLHVHPLAGGLFLGVALILPAVFLPRGEDGEDKVAVSQNGRTDIRRARIDWRVLAGYLDGPVKEDQRKRLGAYFPRRERVLP